MKIGRGIIFAAMAVCLSGLHAALAEGYSTLGIRQYEAAVPHGRDYTRLPVSWKALEQDRVKAKKAWDIILNARKDQPKSERKLYVVYVTFSDRPVLPDVEERYDHMLKNIQVYYADQMKENGFPPLTFGLELDDKGKLVVHYAHVDKPMSEMTVQSSGPVSRKAAKKVLAEKGIDIDNNHALVICQLEDGIGPYYGGGFYKRGTGWTCDQKGLDPRNFLSKEYFGGRYKQTVGGNATIYIGGTAHELGHAFGLPHTRENWLYPDSGRSLMGTGNHTYGQDLRGESKGAYLAPSDALMLASVPLFNGMESPASAYTSNDVEYSDVTIKPVEHGGIISGKVSSGVPCYALVVHIDPPGGSDYDATTSTAVPDSDGRFAIEVKRPDYSGNVDMRITAMFADGTRNVLPVNATIGKEGLVSDNLIQKVYFSKVVSLWEERKNDEALKALEELVRSNPGNADIAKNAKKWRQVLTSKGPSLEYSPADAPAGSKRLSLVDSKYVEVKAGWGVPYWDVMIPSELGPTAYFHDGGEVERFMLIHAVGVAKYDLGGRWGRLTAQFGMPCHKGGSVRFEVIGDGKSLYKTGLLNNGESEKIDIPVKGVKLLEIRVEDGGDGNTSDWAIIGNPVLTR